MHVRTARRRLAGKRLLSLGMGLAIAASANASSVTDWNLVFDQNAAGFGGGPPQRAYLGAVVQIAVHDALNNIAPKYRTYTVARPAPAYASKDAAVATAAHHALVALLGRVPDSTAKATALANIDAAYATALSAIPAGAAKDAGVAAGTNAAADILAMRNGDGYFVPNPPYTLAPAKGVYQPTYPNYPAAANAYLGKVTPFAMRYPGQFMPEPGEIFDLAGTAYAREFNEVKTLGRLETRAAAPTSPMTDIARFWPAGAANWSNTTREKIVPARGTSDLHQQARLFALMQIAEADAAIYVFNTKYTYNFWRPVTAIRWTGDDGNPATTPDPNWKPLFSFPGAWTTPPYPDYTCGLPSLTGANTEVLRRFYGTDAIGFSRTITLPAMVPPAVPPPPPADFPTGWSLPERTITRSYATLSQASAEAAWSRVYAGIHFHSGCVQGVRFGEKVGRFAIQHYLLPL